MNEFLIYTCLFILGTVFGSFYNVLIYRLPRNISIIYPSSHCPNCKAPIKWYDNIPIISYILLKGKCRNCGERISPRYPIVEFLSGAFAVISYYKWGASLDALIYYFFFSNLLVMSVIDWYYFIIPPQLNLGGLVLAITVSPFRQTITFKESVIGALIGTLFLGLLYLFYLKVKKVEALGLGDVILMGFIGAVEGPFGVLISLIAGSIVALVYVLPKILRYKSLQFAIPFGPFLSIGAFAGALFKEQVLNWWFYV